MTLTEIVKHQLQPMAPVPTAMKPDLKPLPDIRALIFDVYGTLLISGSGDVGSAMKKPPAEALKRALAAAGLAGCETDKAAARGVTLMQQFIRQEQQVRRDAGVCSPEIEIREIWSHVMDDLADRKLINREPDPPAIDRVAVEYECRVNPVWPMPGAVEVLNWTAASNLVPGIVSNAQFYTHHCLEALLGHPLSHWGFDDRCCVWSYAMRQSKPAIRMFEPVLTELQDVYRIFPRECLYVGNDMLNDVWTAAQCGCRTALFAGDARSLRMREDKECISSTNPDIILTDLTQLMQILDF